mgnify:CR=1 FL=1
MMRRRFLKWLGLGAVAIAGSCKHTSSSTTSPRLILWDGDGSSESPWSWRSAHGKLDDVESQLLYARLQAAPRLQQMLPGYSIIKK